MKHPIGKTLYPVTLSRTPCSWYFIRLWFEGDDADSLIGPFRTPKDAQEHRKKVLEWLPDLFTEKDIQVWAVQLSAFRPFHSKLGHILVLHGKKPITYIVPRLDKPYVFMLPSNDLNLDWKWLEEKQVSI